MIDESRIKNLVQLLKNYMMDKTVAHGCLANDTVLGIVNFEGDIRLVLVRLLYKLLVKLKNIIFQMPFKAQNIRLADFPFFELIPANK